MYRIIGADGREYGPVSAERLREWIAEGRANAHTRVQAEGSAQWKLLTECIEFAPLLARAAPPLAPGTMIYVARPSRTNPLAVTAMVMGILSITCGLCCCYGAPFNLLGIIFALIALGQIRSDPASEQGRPLAIAGLILSLVSILIAILFLILGLALNGSEILHKLEHM